MVKYRRFCDEPSDYPPPKKLFRSSIIEFDPNPSKGEEMGEEIFLTYTHGRENGPGIVRTGRGPPYMTRIGGVPGETTTHPFGQRLGSWLIQDDLRDKDIEEAKKTLVDLLSAYVAEVEKMLSNDIPSWATNEDKDLFSVYATEVKTKLNNVKASIESNVPWADIKKDIDLLLACVAEAKKTLVDLLLACVAKAEKKLSKAPKARIDELSAEVTEAKAKLSNAIKSEVPKADIDLLSDYVTEAQDPEFPAHDKFFHTIYSDYKIIGQQGCGDLTMNLWNVAYVNSPLSNDKPVLIHLEEEPLEKRIYSCLVKWRPDKGPHKRPTYTIEDVRFDRYTQIANDMVFTRINDTWKPRGDEIEFAVYGKQIIRDGEIVDISRITHEFSDLRHLVLMPNLNPKKGELFENEPLRPNGQYRPRFYFGALQEENVWLGEAVLLVRTNEQRLACLGPMILSRLSRGMGASEEQIRGALEKEGYKKVNDPRQDLKEGQFRFVPHAPTIVEVYFKRNTYGWTIIGLPKNNDKILCLACEGNPGEKIGCTLEHAAEMLIDAGAHNGLLIDEGFDVFQKAQLGWDSLPKAKVAGGGELDVTVPKGRPNMHPPLKRTRLRATFIFAKKKPA